MTPRPDGRQRSLTEDSRTGVTTTKAIVARLRVAIVGCGAVTERLHLPALANSNLIDVTALVDPDPARLSLLAGNRPGVHVAATTQGLECHADAAIVAVPPHLHREIAIELLERGLHVFVEKPLATTLEDADALINAAVRTGRRVGVGVVRRQYSSFRFVRNLIDAGCLGQLKSFDWREGGVFGWPVASAAPFRREQGGGALFDIGAHSLDMLVAWLGEFESLTYRDDERGGVEANCVLDVLLRSGIRGTVELSRTRNLRNTCVIRGQRGELEVGFAPGSEVELRVNGLSIKGPAADAQKKDGGLYDAMRVQVEEFARAVQASAEPPVSAAAVRESIRMFDACRRSRQPVALPWEPFEANLDWSSFAGTSVLVLGGTGFIGGRLVEALAQNAGCRIRVLVRNLSRLSSVARYPIEIINGDAGDAATLENAMKGCDYVFNCTYGKGLREEQSRVNIDAVGVLIQAAAKQRVKQVVHVSTVSVYGVVDQGTLEESTTARAPRRDAYGYTKWKGEELALAEGRRLGVPVAVVQPTVVYGPGAPSWTVQPLRQLGSGKVVLVDGGRGVSNAVYVDDVVTSLLLAAITPAAAGERMLVCGPDVVTWQRFYGALCELLDCDNLVSMNGEQIAAARRSLRRQNGNIARLRALLREEYQGNPRFIELPAITRVRDVVRNVVPRKYIEMMKGRALTTVPAARNIAAELPVHLPDRDFETFCRATAVVDFSKAARIIGYKPRFSFESGMTRVAQWAEWANLIPLKSVRLSVPIVANVPAVPMVTSGAEAP